MTAAIELRELDYGYGGSKVLNQLSFVVAPGDFFVVIGPNGSGKTTLLKLICGFIRAQRGGIDIQGRPIGEYSKRHLARTIAYVPQIVQTDFPFTVAEIVLMGRSPHLGMLGLEQRNDVEIAQEAMRFTGVDHLARRKLSQLSGGECQRVFIARAICQQPRIMLLDEPTASLDLAHQVRVMDLMDELKGHGAMTIVMVSHDVNLAAMYGNRVLLLKDGSVVSIGAPEQVMTYQALEAAYGCTLLVDDSPLGGFPRVTPVPGRLQKSARK